MVTQQAELDLTLLYQSLQHNPDNVDSYDKLRTSDLDDEALLLHLNRLLIL